MSALSRNIMTYIIISATAIPAFAANSERNQPDNLLVWMFLGLCALIILGQIVPLIRSAREHAKHASEQAPAQKQTQSH